MNGIVERLEQMDEALILSEEERQTEGKNLYLAAKRVFDFCASCVALALLSPVLLLIMLLIKLEDHGPAIYRHVRVGMNGRQISIYKFRSMKVNADRLEDMLTPEQLEQYHREFKVDNDPRITKIGNFLRKTSLDELPQLLNIIKGELSVVGPRPVVMEELDKYTSAQRARFLSVKPGLTGYWQAYARNNASYESGERQKMELYYVDHASFLLDMKIILKTVVAVLNRTGAK